MASFIAFTVIFGFNAAFCCLQLLGGADTMTMTTTTTMAQASQSGLARMAATVLFPAVLLTVVLTNLLSFAHMRALGGAGAGAGAGARRLVTGLAKVTFIAATVALLACAVLQLGAGGAVVQIGADGHLDRGRGDVARLNIK